MSANNDIQEEQLEADATLDANEEVELTTEAELSEEEILQAKVAELEEKASGNWDKFVRSQAELDNVKRRAQVDLEKAHKYALEKFTNELLAVHDSMAMGIEAAKADDAKIETIIEGTEMSFNMLSQVFEKFDIKVVDPLNEKFNPDLHQAMSMLPNADVEPNTVLSVMQKGYTLSGRLLRPALVVVSTKA